MSFLEKMKAAAAELEAAQPVDPWRLRLERVRGTTGFDGLERVSTQSVLDFLQVEQRDRRAGTYRELCKAMVSLGWSPTRVRDFARGGYRENVRGFVRQAGRVQLTASNHPQVSAKLRATQHRD